MSIISDYLDKNRDSLTWGEIFLPGIGLGLLSLCIVNPFFHFSLFENFILYIGSYLLVSLCLVSAKLYLRKIDKISKYNIEIKNVGLRYVYNINKRLPIFICEHCLKTNIVKNYNLVCPFCDSSFEVVDNDSEKMIGDTYVRGLRNFANESTIEKVLFDKCPVCGGKTQYVGCQHCGADIDMFKEYNHTALENKRYE